MLDTEKLNSLGSYLVMAIHAVTKPFPYYWPAFELREYEDISKRPSCRDLFPVFHRAYDWHSCVHGFWSIARLSTLVPNSKQVEQGLQLLETELTVEKILGEIKTLQRSEYRSFERPYGLAWVCKLAGELFQKYPKQWLAVEPLADLSAKRILEWHQKLTYPLQTGEHSQSAFALALVKDYAHRIGATSLLNSINLEIERLYATRTRSIIHAEPSGHDFLSPSLGRAMIVGEYLSTEAFEDWLKHYLPELELNNRESWLPVVSGYDAADGKLSHLIGLNLSRSWMLKRIAAKLSKSDMRKSLLLNASAAHANEGHKAVTLDHFASSHWLASFALLDLTDECSY